MEKNIKIRMIATDIENVFYKEVDTIYLNFSDPWPKNRHEHRRLTSNRFLKRYDNLFKNDKNIIIISSIFPVLLVLILLALTNNITIIFYNACYIIFCALLQLTRDIRLFNISDSYIVNKDNQCEFSVIREVVLNFGRIIGFSLLLLVGLTQNEKVLNIVMIV